jgi:hypothetical protein
MDNYKERARAQARPACQIAGCPSKRAVVKGYCRSHAPKHVAKEDMDNFNKVRSASKFCKIADCSKWAQLKGYCLIHAPEHVKKEDMDNFKETQRARKQKAYIEKTKKGGR